ncbi:hypothetical protein NQ315_001691, partial [Exocentrus adspersus]
MSKNAFEVDQPYCEEPRCKSKAYISRVCCDVIEDILKKTYDEENPLTTALEKRVTMVEIRRLRFRGFPSISNTSTDIPEEVPLRLLSDYESNDSDVEEVYEIVENDSVQRDLEYFSGNYHNFIDSDVFPRTGTDLEIVNKVQETLQEICISLGQFVNDRLGLVMERNIFRINNGAPNLENIPLEVRTLASLLAQGDNRNVEELLRTVHQNIVVNVNMSYYFKMMLVMLTCNTLLLFKWILWDQWPLA